MNTGQASDAATPAKRRGRPPGKSSKVTTSTATSTVRTPEHESGGGAVAAPARRTKKSAKASALRAELPEWMPDAWRQFYESCARDVDSE